MNDFYGMADMAKFSGAKRRTLQLWADAKAIIPDESTDHGGTGTQRLFPRNEAIIACVLQAFAAKRMSIGTLIDIGDALRRHLTENFDNRVSIESILIDNRPVFLILTCSEPGAWACTIEEPASGRRNVEKQSAKILKLATEHLDMPDAMTFIIKLNTYLRRPE